MTTEWDRAAWVEEDHEVVHLVKIQFIVMHVPPADYIQKFAQTPVFDVIKSQLITDSHEYEEAEKAFAKVIAAYDKAILENG